MGHAVISDHDREDGFRIMKDANLKEVYNAWSTFATWSLNYMHSSNKEVATPLQYLV